jgi:hypothetical protein
MITGYKLKSKVCLLPGQCYPVDTEIPAWIIIILAGSTVLLINEVVKFLNSQ